MRSDRPPESLSGEVRALLAGLAPELPVRDLSPLESQLASAFLPQRVGALGSGVLGLVGLFLSAMGLYGVLAHFVQSRTHEMGLRSSLGAAPSSLWRLVVGEGARLALAGLGLGVPLAIGVAMLVTGFLYGRQSPRCLVLRRRGVGSARRRAGGERRTRLAGDAHRSAESPEDRVSESRSGGQSGGAEGAWQLPRLQGERVQLRTIVERDARSLLGLFGDRDVVKWMAIRRLQSLDDARALVEEIHTESEARRLFQWALVRREDPSELLGTCTLASIDWVDERAEVGFALLPEARGAGVMSEALRLLIAHAFEDLHLHRLEADVDPRNEPSLRLLERCSFVREGLLRERYLMRGERQDSIQMGLLATDRGETRSD